MYIPKHKYIHIYANMHKYTQDICTSIHNYTYIQQNTNIYVHKHVYTQSYTNIHTYTLLPIYTNTHKSTHVSTNIHKCAHIYTNMYKYTFIYTHIRKYIKYLHIYTFIHKHTQIDTDTHKYTNTSVLLCIYMHKRLCYSSLELIRGKVEPQYSFYHSSDYKFDHKRRHHRK